MEHVGHRNQGPGRNLGARIEERGGLLVAWLFHLLRVPDVAGLVLYGVLVGPLWHLIQIRPDSVGVVNLLSLGAAFILFLGGRQISLTLLNRVKWTVSRLATFGVAITIVILLIVTHLVLGTAWSVSLGIAITMANTDPATIIPVMQRVGVKPLLRITVETEPPTVRRPMPARLTWFGMPLLTSFSSRVPTTRHKS